MLVGIVGKPSCGKSTFFKAATLAEVGIANYPFTTIKPNHAVGFVKIDCVDQFFKKQCNPRFGYCANHKRFVPIDMIDVAGLVPGAHKGEGMGAQFLSDLNQADVLIHVIDISGSVNAKGESVPALSYDPLNDVKFLEDELDFWYLDIMKKGWVRFARQIMQEHTEVHKALGKQLSGLGATEEMVQTMIINLKLNVAKPDQWTDEELLSLASALRKKTKPMLIAANKIDVPGAENNFKRLKEAYPDYIVVPCSAEAELALREAAKRELIDYIPGDKGFNLLAEDKLNEKQKKALEFIKTTVLEKNEYGTGIQEVLNTAVFKLLGYIAIYPGGVNKLEDSEGRVLPDCFLMKGGSTALDFAYKLHTDFGKNFVKAINVKTKMPIGKDHKLQHLDVMEIMANK